MVYGVLTYGFPLLLLLFEWGLRSLLAADASTYMGPTLAAAGLSFMAGLTRPKELAVVIPGKVNASVTSSADRNFVGVVWLVLLLALFAWSAACFFALKDPLVTTFGITNHRLIGVATYVVSLIMVAIKEKV